LETFFGSIRRNRKGQPVSEIFKQLFCFFLDGTSRHLVHFDALARDAGYAGVTETRADRMLSSHAVKRFFGAFWWPRIYLLRRQALSTDQRLREPGGSRFVGPP
jgi:hypothetical protein